MDGHPPGLGDVYAFVLTYSVGETFSAAVIFWLRQMRAP